MAGYSGTPLVKKLGIKPGVELFVSRPPNDYFDWLHPMPPDVKVRARLSGALDFIHLFANDTRSFKEAFSKAKKFLKKDGMLWVSWPKKSSGVDTDLDENIIRDYGLREGLVDVKVCAVDETWSGLKFVFRLRDR